MIGNDTSAGLSGRWRPGLQIDNYRAGPDLSSFSTSSTNIGNWTDEQLWKAYTHLTQAEAAFRIQKDQLRIRPIWHQRTDLVLAQILVVILPTHTHGEIRLRCVTQPDGAQVALFDRLGLVLPKRLRLSEIELPAIDVA